MKRGDLVTIAISGDYGKPRPGLIIQADRFSELSSVTILPLSSDLVSTRMVRVPIQPTAENGLRTPSQVMIDKPSTIPRAKVGRLIGQLDDATMRAIDGALAVFLGLVR